ncbi:MAG: serine hydrolase domain-containing protein [Oscillospiraceae bacterium]
MSIKNREFIKKRVMSFLLSAVLVISDIGTEIIVSANELLTPSGIQYSEISNELDAYVESYEAGLASCEVAVFDETGIITSNYYGFSNIENKIKADDTTVYEWGSCSKLLVWTSVMQQWERGNIDLDADIREYLPEGFLTKLQYEDEKITMKNLMAHNAGFQESFYEKQDGCREDELYTSLEEAVKACECYQAYHVGEFTAYSNWGTALAAYIVECVSGDNYVDYVHKNIFGPLGMQHTSIDPHMRDNEYVRKKREELKCYYRGASKEADANYGTYISWVQLFPAGSAIGTLDDFAKFGMAFVSEDCPLFENAGTRDEMFTPISYYGYSDIAKNCHGLWTDECKVQLLGHGGNTGGCSSMIKFDPESRLGVVIMTNEPGETIFNYGIPNLLFGEITDRPEYNSMKLEDDNDISGIYLSKRTIDSGAVCFQKYIGGLFPWEKNVDGSYDMELLGLNMNPEAKVIKAADHQYIMYNNGMKMFLYQSYDSDGNSKLEMMSADYVCDKRQTIPIMFLVLVILLGLICIVTLMIKLIICIIRRIRKSDNHYDIQITAAQMIYGVTIAALLMYINMKLGISYAMTVTFSIIAVMLGIASLVNGVILCSKTINAKEMKNRTLANRYIWSILSVIYFVFIITFEFYKFWTL